MFEEDPSSDSGKEDPGAEPDKRAEDLEGSDDEEHDLDLAGDGEDVVMCSNSQIQRNVKEVIRTYPEATHGFCFMVMQEPLVVYVDCRFDSSRLGYHGTLPIINTEDDRVIEMVTLTRKQTGSSWKIETIALEEALTSLEQVGLKIQEVVHDNNSQVDAILAQHDIMSSKDLWHKCKNIMGKFKEVLQEKRWSPSDCEVKGATMIAAVVVFLVQQLKDFCRDNGLQTIGSKLQLVQRVSLALQLPKAGASTEI
ncbi:hypothetical protein R1flu_021202 [Riccia fluitans]|uniref:SAP domain-containing protein n=1 Tax=Riccia fluitans TaxID=41844 RepID=A0ABD1ZSB2_9MARC